MHIIPITIEEIINITLKKIGCEINNNIFINIKKNKIKSVLIIL